MWVYLGLGNAYQELNQLELALTIYQQAVKLYPNQADLYTAIGKIQFLKAELTSAIKSYQQAIAIESKSWIHINLGDAYQENNQSEQAIASYQEAIKLKPSLHDVYFKLDKIYQRHQQWHKAEFCYQKILQISPTCSVEKRAYCELKNIYLQQNNVEAANLNHQQEVTKHCPIDHNYKIIYAYIPKNACTLFKTMMVEHSNDNIKYQQSGKNIHEYITRYNADIQLDDFAYFHRQDYFKFAILRNPFNRLVSAYLDKIVKPIFPESFVQQLIKEAQKYLGVKPDLQKSITFNQFINYLANTEDRFLQEHWQSQYCFLGLGLFNFDYFGQFEQLDRVINYLENKFGFKIRIDVSQDHNCDRHITNYFDYGEQVKFHNHYPEAIKALENFPSAENFYTPELKQLVRQRFAKDIEIYQQQFGAI